MAATGLRQATSWRQTAAALTSGFAVRHDDRAERLRCLLPDRLPRDHAAGVVLGETLRERRELLVTARDDDVATRPLVHIREVHEPLVVDRPVLRAHGDAHLG